MDGGSVSGSVKASRRDALIISAFWGDSHEALSFGKAVSLIAGPSNGDSYNCDVPHLTAQQYNFNAALGLSTDLTWKNALVLDNAVFGLLNQSTDSYAKVCSARKDFYNSMGATYSDCTNALFLFTQLDPATNISQAVTYHSIMWNSLDFMCNGGLEIGIQSFSDIWAVFGTDAYKKCVADYFNSTVNSPQDYCNTAQTYAVCVQEAYISEAHIPQNSWFLCEITRHGYAQGCPNFRCQILTS
uniref:Uncharacterized protein n=1 Tax=Panagrellus redivivus TaxID=6233 RepID=A0A7E4ZUA8_PANRE